MSIYYKFKSGKELYSIPVLNPFVSVSEVRDLISQSKRYGHGQDAVLILTNPSTNEDYEDDKILLPRNSSVIVRRIPGVRGGLERSTPPEGYTCHRCKKPGHYIKHCPTNGDPEYDVKRPKPHTGIPKSMLVQTTDGSVAVLKPNEEAFDKLVEGISSTSKRVIDIPPELHCPICKDVMKFAVLTTKCCFQTFCDECIRGNIMSKSMCRCGARGILVDDLIPNKTIRDTINRYIESGYTSSGNTKSTITAEDARSARSSLTKIPSPSPCTSKAEKIKEETSEAKEMVKQEIPSLEKAPSPDSKDEVESTSSTAENSPAFGQEEVQQTDPACENMKTSFTVDGKPLSDNDLFWGTSQAFGADRSMMHFGTSAYNNPYWSGMQNGMGGYMSPYMGYAAGPCYGRMFTQTQTPFGGGSGYALPSQTKKRSRVTPCCENDWSQDSEDDEERIYKRKPSWYSSSAPCYAK